MLKNNLLHHAKIIIDKFHVTKHMRDALKEVRKSVCKQLDKESKTKLFKDRYLLKRANENVTDKNRYSGNHLPEYLFFI